MAALSGRELVAENTPEFHWARIPTLGIPLLFLLFASLLSALPAQGQEDPLNQVHVVPPAPPASATKEIGRAHV